MLTLRGRVRDGRLRLDEPYDAPDGTEIDLAVLDEGDSLEGDDRERLHAALVRSHAQAARREVVAADEVMASLGRRDG